MMKIKFFVSCVIAAVQTLPARVCIAMNGRVYPAGQAWKNYNTRRFKEV